MEQKQAMTSVDLVALTSELQSYIGTKVDKAYLYGDDLVRLKMRSYDEGRLELLIEVGEIKRVHFAEPDNVPSAPGRPPEFAKQLRSHISGADLTAIAQHGFDRILKFEFQRQDSHITLIVELFGDGNVAYLDQTGQVIDCLNTIRLSSRTVAPGSQYEFPTERENPYELDFDTFVATMESSDTDLVRTLATQLDLGGLYAEELCARANVSQTKSIAEATESDYSALHAAIDDVFAPLQNGELDPQIYYEGDTPVDVTPLPLEEYSAQESVPYSSFNKALDVYFSEIETSEEEATTERPDFEAQIEEQQRIIEQQQQAIENFEQQAAQERKKAESLYEHYNVVDELLSTIQEARANDIPWEEIESRLHEGSEQGIEAAELVNTINEDEGTVTIHLDDRNITLDCSMGVEQNANQLYQEAKRIESKKEGAKEAIEETREELEQIKSRREQWESEPEQKTNEETEIDWLERSSIPVRQHDHWYDRFRWFHTSDGFLVLGGRNASQNEELVEKYMDKYDLFFHTQAYGAPATILKKTGPSEPSEDIDVPDQSIFEAAQFAVSYSSLWKEGKYSGDVYHVSADQVSKTPESGEYLAKGGFAIRGDRVYHRDTPVGVAIGVQCEEETHVIGGPPNAIEPISEVAIAVEPGRYAQADIAKRIYRQFRESFTDTSFVRKVASPDLIQHFLPPGGSRISDGD